MIEQPPLGVGDVVRVNIYHPASNIYHPASNGWQHYFFPGCLGRLVEEKEPGFWVVTLFDMGNIETHLRRGLPNAYGGWWNSSDPLSYQTHTKNLKLFARRGGPDDAYPDPLPR